MAIFDNAGNAINKGIASIGRGTKAFTIKAQISDLETSRIKLLALLGEKLFEDTKTISDFRLPNENLYQSIEEVYEQQASLQAELDAIERQTSISSLTNSKNNGEFAGIDSRSLLDASAHENLVKSKIRQCPICKNSLNEDDAFCMKCGAPVGSFSECGDANENVESSNSGIAKHDEA